MCRLVNLEAYMGSAFTSSSMSRMLHLQVGKLSGEILARVLPEGVKL